MDNNNDTITLELDKDAARALLKCVGRQLQTLEGEMDRFGTGKRFESARHEWQALDDVLAQLQEVKRDRWYGDSK